MQSLRPTHRFGPVAPGWDEISQLVWTGLSKLRIETSHLPQFVVAFASSRTLSNREDSKCQVSKSCTFQAGTCVTKRTAWTKPRPEFLARNKARCFVWRSDGSFTISLLLSRIREHHSGNDHWSRGWKLIRPLVQRINVFVQTSNLIPSELRRLKTAAPPITQPPLTINLRVCCAPHVRSMGCCRSGKHRVLAL